MRAAIGDAGLVEAMRTAVERDLAAIGQAALGRDVDDARRSQTVFGGQGAGDQLHALRIAWTQDLTEIRQAFWQDDAV